MKSQDGTFILTKIAGISFRQEFTKDLKSGDILTLIREPNNQYDPNAIAIFFNGNQLGYVNKFNAESIAPRLDAGTKAMCVVKELTGGGQKTQGVNIMIKLSE